MPHFKDSENRVYWLDDAETAHDDLTPITEDDAAALLAPSLDDARVALWLAVKAERDVRTDAPGSLAQTPFGAVQVDAKSKQNVNGLVTMALIAKGAGAPFSEDFTLADNSVVTLNADQMIGLGVAVGEHVATAFSRARELRVAIADAATVAELDAIDITSGWP